MEEKLTIIKKVDYNGFFIEIAKKYSNALEKDMYIVSNYYGESMINMECKIYKTKRGAANKFNDWVRTYINCTVDVEKRGIINAYIKITDF